jgi:S-adenosylmethionine synthetase
MFTDIEKCKSCNNPVLNALNYHSVLFDSLDIDYEVILKCRRKRETEDYKHYFKLDTNLRIVALNDSITSLYEPKSLEQYFVLTRNDTIIFTTENLDLLLGFITN